MDILVNQAGYTYRAVGRQGARRSAISSAWGVDKRNEPSAHAIGWHEAPVMMRARLIMKTKLLILERADRRGGYRDSPFHCAVSAGDQ